MKRWTTEKVYKFLNCNEFDEEVVGIFKMNKIYGSVPCTLNEADMKELALGDQRRLQSLIKKEFESLPAAVTAEPQTAKWRTGHMASRDPFEFIGNYTDVNTL